MTRTIDRASDGTISLTITLPWPVVEAAYREALEKAAKETQIPGFRKGKAPSHLVEHHAETSKLYEQAISSLVPKLYKEAIEEEKLKPVISPDVQLKDAQEKKDWVIVIKTCEKPHISVGEYRQSVQALSTDKQTSAIWTPDKAPEQPTTEEKKGKKPPLEEILHAVVQVISGAVPEIMIEKESSRLLSRLIDQTKTLGLTIDQYLSSTGRTGESIREEYRAQAKNTILLEFALEQIAEKESITVSDEDIDRVLSEIKNEEERKSYEKERYYLASMLRRQKTLDFLASLL